MKNIKKYLISFLPVIIFSLIPLNHSAQTAEFKTLFGEVVNDSIEVRPVMYLALSYDHRIVDGKEAVSFLKIVKESLEQPKRLFLNM